MGVARVACGIDTGSVVQSFYFQACIVRETIQTIFLVDIPGFLKGIAFERVLFLGNILVALNLFQGNDLVPGTNISFISSNLWALLVAKTNFMADNNFIRGKGNEIGGRS